MRWNQGRAGRQGPASPNRSPKLTQAGALDRALKEPPPQPSPHSNTTPRQSLGASEQQPPRADQVPRTRTTQQASLGRCLRQRGPQTPRVGRSLPGPGLTENLLRPHLAVHLPSQCPRPGPFHSHHGLAAVTVRPSEPTRCSPATVSSRPGHPRATGSSPEAPASPPRAARSAAPTARGQPSHLFSLSAVWNWLYRVLVLRRAACREPDVVEPLLWSLSRLRLRVEPEGPSCRYTPSERRWWGTLDTSRELGAPWGPGTGPASAGRLHLRLAAGPPAPPLLLTRPSSRPSRRCAAFTRSQVSFQRSGGRPSSASSRCSSCGGVSERHSGEDTQPRTREDGKEGPHRNSGLRGAVQRGWWRAGEGGSGGRAPVQGRQPQPRQPDRKPHTTQARGLQAPDSASERNG